MLQCSNAPVLEFFRSNMCMTKKIPRVAQLEHHNVKPFLQRAAFQRYRNRYGTRCQIIICQKLSFISNDLKNIFWKCRKQSCRTQTFWRQFVFHMKHFIVCGVVISFYVVQFLVLASNCALFVVFTLQSIYKAVHRQLY